MFENLANDFVEWDHSQIFQVDERVVPADSDLRNLKSLRESLLGTEAPIEPMDVDNPDLDAACRDYAAPCPSDSR